ncbi:MAG TPA: DUF488 domain-containing protein [Lamprocystis sp. (in: g-proteobacteria)]|nr:DUF488 domain-containing protein [Lamprocystis sp. (in: g-proteobacteria)]
MKLYTIGFTKKTAEQFFTKLCAAGVKRIVDVRLNNVSQLAGFAKRDDLRFFAKAVCGMGYLEQPELAPTKDILDAYKKDGGDWETYEGKFLALMERRRIEERVPKEVLDQGCLLCSEHKPHHCHRRLVAEYLQGKWGDIDIVHIE